MIARVAALSLAAWCAAVAIARADADLAAAKTQILNATNALRRENKLEPLATNEKLEAAAIYFADYMAKSGLYGHAVDGRQPWDRAVAAGYEYCQVRENINYLIRIPAPTTDELAAKMMEGWRQSPEHLKNMLDPDVVDIGVGVAVEAATGKYYAVQNFGRPRSQTTRFTLINESSQTVSYQVDDMPYTLVMNAAITHERCTSRPAIVRLTSADGTSIAETRAVDGEQWTVRDGEGGKLTIVRRDNPKAEQ